jgi:hypothetical protein
MFLSDHHGSNDRLRVGGDQVRRVRGQGERMKWGSIRSRSVAEIPTQVGDLIQPSRGLRRDMNLKGREMGSVRRGEDQRLRLWPLVANLLNPRR